MKPYALEDTDPDALGQFYNLEEDPGETGMAGIEQQMRLWKPIPLGDLSGGFVLPVPR